MFCRPVCLTSILQQGEKLFDKLSTVVTSKAAVMKEKLTNYIKNEQPPVDRYNRNNFPEVETILRNLLEGLTFSNAVNVSMLFYLYFLQTCKQLG